MATINQVGNGLTGSTGTGSFVGAGTPTLITPVLGAATGTSVVLSGKATANNFVPGFLTQATAGATTTLLVSSAQVQAFTGTLNQIIVMPVTSTLEVGQQYYIINDTVGGVLSVQSSGAFLIQDMAPNTSLILTCVLVSGVTTASWQAGYITDAGGTVNIGTINQLAYYAAAGNAVSGLTGANSALLVTSSTGVPSMTASLTNGQVIVGSTGATPVPALLTAGTGIVIANGAGTITISSPDSGITWSEIAGITQAAAVNNGYIVGNVALTTVTLPATAAIGDVIAVRGLGAGGWVLAANAGQTIKYITATTTSGGALASAEQYDNIDVTCIVANTTWTVAFAATTGLTVS